MHEQKKLLGVSVGCCTCSEGSRAELAARKGKPTVSFRRPACLKIREIGPIHLIGLMLVVSGHAAYHRGGHCPKDAALACGRNTLLTLADTEPLYAGGHAAKADRLRQAKQEAEREVKSYKAQREEQYQKRIADVRH